ncbi:MAG TPA: lysophospholipid acyltransferase family protein [Thermomicrobiales bacterium]|nr:lysophospholipid acyltransferase family protein [Thermomicrobiales bacterium]
MTSRDEQQMDLRKGTMSMLTFRILRPTLYGLCKILVRLDVQGARNVPKGDGCIIVSNHLHNLDPVLISIACPRPLHYMAKIELMRVPVIGRILRWVGAFPINRGKMDRPAIKRAQATLQQDIALGMFPEGTRSTAMKIQRVLPGAGLLALRDGVKIVPTAITGTERLPFNGIKQQRDHASMPDPGHKGVRIVFGDPFVIPGEIDGKRTGAAGATDHMMQRVAALLPDAYRGIYCTKQSEIIEVEDEIP